MVIQRTKQKTYCIKCVETRKSRIDLNLIQSHEPKNSEKVLIETATSGLLTSRKSKESEKPDIFCPISSFNKIYLHRKVTISRNLKIFLIYKTQDQLLD